MYLHKGAGSTCQGKDQRLHPFTGSAAPPRGKVRWVRFRDVANTGPFSETYVKVAASFRGLLKDILSDI